MAETILIAGYYGFGNLGDEAILSGMLHDLRTLEPDLRFIVASADPQLTNHTHGVTAIDARDLPEVVTTMEQSDLVLLGGGGLFHDYWEADPRSVLSANQEGQAYYAAIPLLARMLGKRCMIYAAGVGPLRTENSRRLTRQAFALAQRSTVRDGASFDLLKSIGLDVSHSRVEVTADPAFSLEVGNAGGGRDLRLELGHEAGTPLVGVCLRNWDLPGLPADWEVEVAEGTRAVLLQTGAQAVLIPFQQRPGWSHTDDRAIAVRLHARLGESLSCVLREDRIAPADTASLFSSLACVLTMRLHAALFAVEAGVPVVSLACDPKLEHVMSDFGVGQWCLAPERWERSAIRDSLLMSMAEQDPDALRLAASRLHLRSQANARIAVELLHEPPPAIDEPERLVASLALEKSLSQAALTQAMDRLTEQMEVVAGERNRLDEQVSNITDTFGFRLLDAYWDAMRRVFPPGSVAKRVYRLATGLLRKGFHPSPDVLPAYDQPISVHSGGQRRFLESRPASQPAMRISSDARLELARFAARAGSVGWKSVVAIVSPVQLIESEGQRATNLALELAARGHGVVFAYWRWDTSPWSAQEQLERGILQVPFDVLSRHPRDMLAAFPGIPRRILYEFPHPSLFSFNGIANAEGWVTVYDAIDEWEEFHRVGQAPWYDGSIEEHLACAADVVLAVNGRLATKMRAFGRDDVDLLPNAARTEIQGHGSVTPLEKGEVTLGYFGHLSQAWFDWGLLDEVARMRPRWRFYLIGYGLNKRGSRMRDNIAYLGKMPQDKLAGYAANWDVGIVPFVPGELAAGADAIKVYEYLAMDLPVVVTGVFPPIGAEQIVLRAEDAGGFVAKVEQAVAARRSTTELRTRFVGCNTWPVRTDRLLEILEANGQRAGVKRALFDGR
ncbi:MAG: polysaccharide pyruvyl transferase family protein [Actinobacteria bacterium]|nr:polysaccharide pyruvyl transferase family protein [Actinomycetota bacterium]